VDTVKADLGLYQAKFWLRRYLQKIPGVRSLSPNVVSLLALIPGVAAAYCLNHKMWLSSVAAIAARMILNTLDGLIAEQFAKHSHLGAYLNRLPSEITDLLIALALYPFAPSPWGLLFVALTALVQTLGLLGLVGQGKTQAVGPCGQTDRLAIIGIACIPAAFGAHVWPFVIKMMCFGCLLTAGLRIQRSIKELSQLDHARVSGI